MIPFLDIKQINLRQEKEIKEATNRVIESGWYVLGNEVKNFENKLSQYNGVKNCIATSNGLDALKIIIRAYSELGVFNEGDEILVPANTFVASVLAISDAKLVPVLVEVSEEDMLIDVSEIKSKLSEKTKGIMNVHLYGQISYSEDLQNIIDQENLIHIEDNAQGIGSVWENNVKAGALGHASAISFYPGKNLGALGDAGAILTNDDTLATLCRQLANYGSKEKYVHEYRGYNNRMDEMQAAILSVKLDWLDKDNNRRREIAKMYVEGISHSDIVLPKIPSNNLQHVWHLFVIRSTRRDELQEYLMESGIQSLIHYPIPIHMQKSYSNISGDYSLTERLSKEILSLPISPVLTDAQVQLIIDEINQF
jgi:dTDP-4-amino-4,6-dideoxygalactose transaminase